ncbi:Organic cation transporter protein-like 25 [Homarus americanus]|uniref:Organic cation transporter protein-like 25 n=1 Tax=Homarus americanus TaxID=6706 RepID=A0A8J5JBM4_HOMAM|nr:Organic cation transporter protein-like 25 [Homarus americanus]
MDEGGKMKEAITEVKEDPQELKERKEVVQEEKEGKEVVQGEKDGKEGDLSWVNTFEDLLEFLGATPDYWCHIAPLVEANWTDQQILSLAIPYSNSTGKYEGCQMRNYNYTAAALLGYKATMKDPSVVQHGNTTSIIKCSARDFNHSQYSSTVVTEWDLVCERRVLYSTTQAVMEGGKIVAYPIFGYLIDALGRRPIVLVCVVINILAGFLVAASPTVEVYILLKLIVSATDAGTYLGIFVFGMFVFQMVS